VPLALTKTQASSASGEVQLGAVQPLHARHLAARHAVQGVLQLGRRPAHGLGAAQVEVEAVVGVPPAGGGLQGGEALAERLAGCGHALGEQERVRQPVALEEVLAHPDPARLLAAYQHAAPQHGGENVLEPDFRLHHLEAAEAREALDDPGDRDRLDDGPAPAAGVEVVEQHGEDLV